MPEKLSHLLRQDRRAGGAWLLFMSETNEKRRLAPVPNGWASLPDAELEALCARAKSVPPSPVRRSDDREPDK
jgi:hypothetical protein